MKKTYAVRGEYTKKKNRRKKRGASARAIAWKKMEKKNDVRDQKFSRKVPESRHENNRIASRGSPKRNKNNHSNRAHKPMRLIVTSPKKLFVDMKKLCQSSNTDVLKFLIQGGVDVDTRDHMGSTLLMHMVTAGNRYMARVLLDLKADPNATNRHGDTALHSAYLHKFPDLIRLLEISGAYETQRNKKGVTPVEMALTLQRNANTEKHMWQAFKARDVMSIADVVRQGGTVDVRNDKGLTPLMLAVKRRDVRMVKCLLEQQADPNLREPQHLMTAMHYALLRESHDKINAQIVALLKASNASMFIRNRLGYTAKDWSRKVRKKAPGTMPHAFRNVCIEGILQEVELFLQDGNFVNARDDFGKTALILAAENGHTKVCRTILKAKADPNIQETNSQCNTALHYAHMFNNVTLQELLIRYGADTRISNAMGCDCIEAGRRAIAARRQRHRSQALASTGASGDIERKRKPYCHELKVQLMLGNFAGITKMLVGSTETDPVYIDGQNASGNTVLMEAVEQGMIVMVNFLLTKCEADPNITNNRNETALHIAYDRDFPDIIEILKLNGAQETIRNSIGFSPSEMPNRPRIKAKRLAASPRYTDPRLLQAVESGDLKEIERLIKSKQVNPNLISKRTGDTALIHAAKRNRHEVCELLLLLRADVNVRNRSGNTALHIAFANFNEKLQSVLLKGEADVTLQNKFGETPCGLQKLITHLPGGRSVTSYAPPTSSWANRKPQDESMLEALAAKFSQPMSPMLASLVEIGDVTAVKDFFNKKANVDVNACNRRGNTALMHAVIHNQIDMIKYLVQEKGADINLQNRHGNTALHLGFKYGDYPPMMHALLELKADPSLANNLGANPMQLYERFMRLESDNSSADWDANYEFREFMDRRNFVAKFAALLLRDPVDATATSPTNKTRKGRVKGKQTKAVGDDVQAQLIALMRERYQQAPGDTRKEKQTYMQATFNFQTVTGDTLLALAIKRHNHRIARALVPHTNPNITNKHGRSALHAAYEEEDYDMVELLEYLRVK